MDCYAIPWDARQVVEKTDDLLPEERKFAEEVARLRKERGWTQAQMAEVLVEYGVSYMTQSTVSRVEKLQRPARLGEGQAWAKAFNRPALRMMHPTPVDELIESAEWNLGLMRHAWSSLDAELRRYARVRGDLDGTIEELREDSRLPGIDEGRASELQEIAGHLDEYRRRERDLHVRLAAYAKEEFRDV